MNPYFNPYYLRNISSVQCIHNTTNDFEIKVVKEKYIFIIRLVDFLSIFIRKYNRSRYQFECDV